MSGNLWDDDMSVYKDCGSKDCSCKKPAEEPMPFFKQFWEQYGFIIGTAFVWIFICVILAKLRVLDSTINILGQITLLIISGVICYVLFRRNK